MPDSGHVHPHPKGDIKKKKPPDIAKLREVLKLPPVENLWCNWMAAIPVTSSLIMWYLVLKGPQLISLKTS